MCLYRYKSDPVKGVMRQVAITKLKKRWRLRGTSEIRRTRPKGSMQTTSMRAGGGRGTTHKKKKIMD